MRHLQAVPLIVTLLPERAMEEARKADKKLATGTDVGPLHGLPIAHKDLVQTKGIRTTFGSLVFKDFVPEEDALLVERIRALLRRRELDVFRFFFDFFFATDLFSLSQWI